MHLNWKTDHIFFSISCIDWFLIETLRIKQYGRLFTEPIHEFTNWSNLHCRWTKAEKFLNYGMHVWSLIVQKHFLMQPCFLSSYLPETWNRSHKTGSEQGEQVIFGSKKSNVLKTLLQIGQEGNTSGVGAYPHPNKEVITLLVAHYCDHSYGIL